MHMLPGVIFKTDCDSVRVTYQQGLARGTAYSKKFARVRAMIFANLDVHDVTVVVWMPAHTSVGQVGHAECSNGRKLSAVDRDSNSFADELAKSQALAMRVPIQIRKQLQDVDREVFEIA